MKPKVSIILVNYNGDKDTLDCVSSIEKIIYKNYEIIVVDNASDNQGELENKLPTGVVLIKSKKNLGIFRLEIILELNMRCNMVRVMFFY